MVELENQDEEMEMVSVRSQMQAHHIPSTHPVHSQPSTQAADIGLETRPASVVCCLVFLSEDTNPSSDRPVVESAVELVPTWSPACRPIRWDWNHLCPKLVLGRCVGQRQSIGRSHCIPTGCHFFEARWADLILICGVLNIWISDIAKNHRKTAFEWDHSLTPNLCIVITSSLSNGSSG